jgi:hypothetical protein
LAWRSCANNRAFFSESSPPPCWCGTRWRRGLFRGGPAPEYGLAFPGPGAAAGADVPGAVAGGNFRALLVLDDSLRAGLWRLQSLPDGWTGCREFFATGCDRWFYLTGTVGLLALLWRKAAAERRFFFAHSSSARFLPRRRDFIFADIISSSCCRSSACCSGTFLPGWPRNWARTRQAVAARGADGVIHGGRRRADLAKSGYMVRVADGPGVQAMYLAEGFVECRGNRELHPAHSAPEDRIAVFGLGAGNLFLRAKAFRQRLHLHV